MYYNVVVNPEDNEYDFLVFHFEEDFEKAKEFIKTVWETSDYEVKIIPILKENEGE